MRCLLVAVCTTALLLLLQGLPSCSSFQHSSSLVVGTTSSFTHRGVLAPVPPGQQQLLRKTGSVTTSISTTRTSRRTTSSSTSLGAAAASAGLIAGVASPFGAVTVLAFIVLIHELGHYLAARGFGITVEEFSIGFGPKLIGFTKFGNEFNLRALPLGGFVRFPENYDIENVVELERQAEKAAQERRKRTGRDTPLDEVVNIATFGIVDEQLRKADKKEREQLAAAFEAEQQKESWWKRIFSSIGGKSKQQQNVLLKDDPEEFQVEYYDDPNLLQNRPWPQRLVVLSGGVIMNMVLAFTLYFGAINFGSGIPQPVFEPGVVISATPKVNVPSSGLLQKGDVIVGINGKLLSMESRSPMGAQKEVSDVISVIRNTPDGESVQLDVLRNGQTKDISIQPKVNGGGLSTTNGPKTIGVMLQPNFLKVDRIKSDNIIQSSKLATKQLIDTTSSTLEGFKQLLTTMLSGKGAPPGQSVSGPIGLIKTGSEVVSTQDITTVIMFAAAISINLGVVNALPLPALDGGQIAFVIAEAVTGRKIDQRFQEGITSVAILLLLLITVKTAFGDVESILNR